MRLLNTLKYKYYNIKISCKNLFNWFNIIWNNREYDYLFVLLSSIYIVSHTTKIQNIL